LSTVSVAFFLCCGLAMNILFASHGDFTANSIHHIGPFADALELSGCACVVAVPFRPESCATLPPHRYRTTSFDAFLAAPTGFPDHRGPDIVHAWTPREHVRRFALACLERVPTARLFVHLEDNEDHLLSACTGKSQAELIALGSSVVDGAACALLAHPALYPKLLRRASGITVITPRLREFAPPEVPVCELAPGLEPAFFGPRPPDPNLRESLGLRAGEKVIVYPGSPSFANEAEMRSLYGAVALLGHRGHPTRLVRSGFTATEFRASLPDDLQANVVELGFVQRSLIPSLLALADVLVQPGRPGPFDDYRLPSKLPEFLASGRPVVLPRTNIGLELRDGVDALILRDGSPEDIAHAAERIFDDPALASTLSANGAAFAKRRFDLATQTARLAAFYRRNT
jgi:glycosyltransferase involved in cell wall biosynthesis